MAGLSGKQKLAAILNHDEVFSGFNSEDKLMLLKHARLQRFLPAQHMLRQDQLLEDVYVLLDGALHIGWLRPNGELKVNDLVQNYSAFNLVALLQNKPLTYDYFAVGRVEVALIPAPLFFSLMYAQPKAMQQLIQLLSQRMYHLFEHNRYLQTANLNQRMARHLLKLSRLYGRRHEKGIVLQIKLSQQDFSELFNVSRQTLNKHVQYLVQEKIISWGYSQIQILDLPRLEQLSQI